MGKAKKLKISKAPRNAPLESHIEKEEFAVPTGRVKQRKERKDETDEFIDDKLSKQILNQARLQMQDLQRETKKGQPAPLKLPNLGDNMDSDEEDDGEDVESVVDDDEKAFNDDIKKNYNMSKKDEETFQRFINSENGPRKTLGEILQEKIQEKRTEIDTQYTDAESLQRRELDPRVVEMYQGIGEVLKRYRSGKVPKAFKVIAQFRNWEDFLSNLQNVMSKKLQVVEKSQEDVYNIGTGQTFTKLNNHWVSQSQVEAKERIAKINQDLNHEFPRKD